MHAGAAGQGQPARQLAAIQAQEGRQAGTGRLGRLGRLGRGVWAHLLKAGVNRRLASIGRCR